MPKDDWQNSRARALIRKGSRPEGWESKWLERVADRLMEDAKRKKKKSAQGNAR